MVSEPARLIACKTAIQRLIDRIGTPFSNAQLLAVQDDRTVSILDKVKNGEVKNRQERQYVSKIDSRIA
jgi:hypothetical protein